LEARSHTPQHQADQQMPSPLIQAVQRFSTMKVVVVGDVMLDMYEHCYTAQSKPIDSEKAGRRAYTAQALHRHLGGAGNVAANLAAFGVETTLVGVAGNDGHHLTVTQLLKEHGIRCSLVEDPQRQTTTKNRLYLDDEYVLRRDDERTSPIPQAIANRVFDQMRDELYGANAVILSDYAKGVFSEPMAQAMIAACHARSTPVIVDFKPSNKAMFRQADIIAPNAGEAESLFPGFNTTDALEHDTRALYAHLQSRHLIVTLGNQGICGFDGQTFFHHPAYPVPVVDAVGCGDTVRASLAAGYSAGLSLKDSAALANRAAGLVCKKQGTASVSYDELLADLTGTDG